MDQAVINSITQLGLSSIFAFACVALFNRLETRNSDFVKYLMEQNTISRQQNTVLMDQNKMLSIALFGNNPDAQRAYHAMVQAEKSTSVSSVITNLGEK